MELELETIHVVLAAITLLLGILGRMFGWFSKLWDWLRKRMVGGGSPAVVEIPKKTIILLRNRLLEPSGGTWAL
jgi:hypothetical protein